MDKQEQASLSMLHSIPGLGGRHLRQLRARFGNFTAVLQAEAGQLADANLTVQLHKAILEQQHLHLDQRIDYLENEKIEVITQDDTVYPQSLQHLGQPPYVLYCKGTVQAAENIGVAVVGSRKASPYGRHVAHLFGQELAIHQINVISGLARGIDTEAHWGALTGQGKTIAVLGSGIDVIYPRENHKLYARIIEAGAVFSEFPLGTPPEGRHFPQRNRIIAGLSTGVIVVEADEKSGALITVDFALEQGKDVFAVPGPITSATSAGTNQLIKQGAKPVTEIADVLQEYMFLPGITSVQESTIDLNAEEQNILEYLDFTPVHMESLIADAKIEVGRLSELLLKLEMYGLLKRLPGNYYIRVV